MAVLHDKFAASGDPTRFAIVARRLTEADLPAGALQTIADISAPAISRHLKVLREAGLVSQRAEGQRRIYSIEGDAMREVEDWVTRHREMWTAKLDRLEAALSALAAKDR